MTTLIKFDEVRDAVKEFLPQYLAKFGIDARERKKFHCISPGHNDAHPSANLIPGANLVHCHSCGFTGDIFEAANAKESKPLTGRGFITDNLMYLAKMFNVPLPDLNLSNEEMAEIDMRRAYAQAARIILTAKKSEIVTAKLAEYKWSADVLTQFGIGSVTSYDDYIRQMTKIHGHSLEFLESIDLTRKGIFHENSLIYTIKDEHGSPIAFSARDLDFEEKSATYKKKRAAIEASAETDSVKTEQKALLFQPRKYVNTKETILFTKGEVLYNFDQARKSSSKSIVVFEGNADCVTLFAGGIKMATALLGTAFTPAHLELILAAGITRLTLVLDPDQGGQKGTDRFVKMLDQFGGHPGLDVELILMPEGTNDPDAYVRAFGDLKTGVSEFRKLPRIDLFTWKMKKAVDEGADPITIVTDALPYIVNMTSNMERLRRADRLAAAAGLPREFVQRELLRLLDANEMQADEQRLAITQQTIKQLTQNPKGMDSILAQAQLKLDAIAESKTGYDPQVNLKAYRHTIDKLEATTDMNELLTGFPIFDSVMGGIPKEAVMMSIPGAPHHGKSIVLDNLIVGALDHNPKLQVFLHHVDDAALMRIPRILGVMSGLSSRQISKAGASLMNLSPEFEERYRKAEQKLTRWIEEERLILADQSILVNSLTAHERWIKEIRRRNSDGHFISIGDNFHLFDMPGMEPGEGKVREMSRFISNLPTKHGITTLFSMELPKDILRPGIRPKYTDSKSSGGIAFDSKVNMNVYQDLQSLGEESVLTWRSPDVLKEVIGPDGSTSLVEEVMPIVELIIDKNKFTGEKRTIFYRLEPMSGRMEECSALEQAHMSTTLIASKADRKDKAKAAGKYAEHSRAF